MVSPIEYFETLTVAQGRDKAQFPSAIEACFLVFALFLVEYFIVGFLSDVRSLSGLDPRDLAAVIVILGNGVLFTGLLHYKGLSYPELFHPAKHSISATIFVLALPVLMIVPGAVVLIASLQDLLLLLFPMSASEQAMFERMMSGGIASIIAVCLVAPVVEEMLFRGIILRSFLRQYPKHYAILGSAVIFGAAHMNLYQFVAGLGSGLVLGWLYERSQSLWPGILFHASYNSIAIWFYDTQESSLTSTPSLALVVPALVFTLFGAMLLRRLLVPLRTEP